MKKAMLFQSLIYVGLVASVNSLIQSLPLSVTNKVIALTAYSFVCLSVVLLAIRAWSGSWSTTRPRAGLNRLATLAGKERLIKARLALVEAGRKRMESPLSKTESETSDYKSFDEWQQLNEADKASNQ